MVYSNINVIFESVDYSDVKCSICGKMNYEVHWASEFNYFDKKTKINNEAAIDEVYYYCDKCGYVLRVCSEDYSGHFMGYELEGISIMETPREASKQIAVLRKNSEKIQNLKILDYKKYKPYFYEEVTQDKRYRVEVAEE